MFTISSNARFKDAPDGMSCAEREIGVHVLLGFTHITRTTPSRAARSDPSAGGARAPRMTPGEYITPEAYNDA